MLKKHLSHHSLNIPVTNGERGGGRYGDFKILNNEGGQVKNLSINGHLRHNGGGGGGGRGVNPIQSNFGATKDNPIQSDFGATKDTG